MIKMMNTHKIIIAVMIPNSPENVLLLDSSE
jgi:hypothetical protein